MYWFSIVWNAIPVFALRYFHAAVDGNSRIRIEVQIAAGN